MPASGNILPFIYKASQVNKKPGALAIPDMFSTEFDDSVDPGSDADLASQHSEPQALHRPAHT
eukprot:9857826-Karenia_brevis.AAC.1